MKNLLKKLRHKVILYVFNYYFSDFIYGFTTADDRIAAMNETQKTLYFERVTDWVESDAYAIENKGKIEDCYKKLAGEAVGEDIFTAYRLALLLMKNQDIRYRMKVDEYKKIKASRRAFNQVNNT